MASMPENQTTPDDLDNAALDEDAAPRPGTAEEPGSVAGSEPTPTPDAGPAGAGTVLDGPALENEQMRRGTQDLQSSEAKIDQAREYAHDVARATEPAQERSGPS